MTALIPRRSIKNGLVSSFKSYLQVSGIISLVRTGFT